MSGLTANATRWWIGCVVAAALLTACTGSDSRSDDTATDVEVERLTASEPANSGGGSPRSFILLDAEPADLPVLTLPSDSGEVEVRVGPRPDGGPGVCVVGAFGTLPNQVACFEPGSDGRLIVLLRTDGQPTLFIDDRVVRVTLYSDGQPERELQLVDVPGLPGARITQGALTPDAGNNPTLAFYDDSGTELVVAQYEPPRP